MSGIAIVDVLQVPGAKLDQVRERYLADYAPTAWQRGMVLSSTMQTPPVQLLDGVNTLTITWTVSDLAGWWRMRLMGASDPVVAEFWRSITPHIISRDRRFHTVEGHLQAETSDV